MLFFITQHSSGQLTEKQILAKEICLVTLSAKSGTNIVLEHNPDLIIEKKENGILVGEEGGITGYFYDCYGNFEINPVSEGKTELKIK